MININLLEVCKTICKWTLPHIMLIGWTGQLQSPAQPEQISTRSSYLYQEAEYPIIVCTTCTEQTNSLNTSSNLCWGWGWIWMVIMGMRGASSQLIMPLQWAPREQLLCSDLSRLWADISSNSYIDSMCFVIFGFVHHAIIMFSRRNSMFKYCALIIVNILLLLLIPTLLLPQCIFWDFVILDGGFSCMPTTLLWIHDQCL